MDGDGQGSPNRYSLVGHSEGHFIILKKVHETGLSDYFRLVSFMSLRSAETG